MDIIQMNVSDLIPYNRNTKKHPKEQIKHVANSIKEFGFQQPLVIDKNNVVVIGHCRLLAAKQLKFRTVPCLIAEQLTDNQIKALRLADNKTNESEWDLDILNDELNDIFDFNMTDFGFDLSFDEETIEPHEDNFDINDISTNESVSKLGDIWKLGKHRLMCGDATNNKDVNALMNGILADLIITDPPYNVNYEGKTVDKLKIINDNFNNSKQFRMFLLDAFLNMYQYSKKGASAYIFHADTEGYNFRGAFCDAGFKLSELCIWVKNSMVMGRNDYQWQHEPVLCGEHEIRESEFEPILYGWSPESKHNWHSDRKQKTVWYFDKPLKNKEHPTMKPIKLIAYPMQNSSKIGDIVMDLFGGSGSTLVACEQLKRICHMMEFDPKYIDVIIRRYIDFKNSSDDVYLLTNNGKIPYREIIKEGLNEESSRTT